MGILDPPSYRKPSGGIPIGDLKKADLDANYANTVSVKSFGAKGDGTTDDTSAIKSAISAAGQYGNVVFPTGTYVHNDAFVPLTGQRFTGEGILIGGNAKTGLMASRNRQIHITTDDVEINGLRFAAPLSAYTGTDFECCTIYILGGKNVKIVNNIFKSTTVAWAVWVKDPSTVDTLIERNYADGSGFVYTYYGAQRTVTSRNTSINAPYQAFWGGGNNSTNPADFCRVIDNTSINAGYTAIEDGAYTRGTLIARNMVKNSGISPGAPGYGGGGGISAVGIYAKVDDNVVIDFLASNYGVEIGSSGSSANGNKITFSNATPASNGTGVVCQGTAAALTTGIGANISNNFIENANKAILVAQAASKSALNVIISNNVVVNAQRAISAEQGGSQGCTISSNSVRFTIPATATRFGINVGVAQGIAVLNNHIEYSSGSAGGNFYDNAMVLYGDFTTASGNVIDGGGRSDTYKPSVSSNGGTPSFVRFINNTVINGAGVNLANMVNPMQWGNKVTSGGIVGVALGGLEFFGSGNTITTKPTLTGSRTPGSGDASLASQLATLGLVTDSTTTGLQSKSSNYTAVAADRIVLATGGSGGITITLPGVAVRQEISIKKIDNGSGAVTVTPASGTIDGAATLSLSAQWQIVRLVSDGTNWFTT